VERALIMIFSLVIALLLDRVRNLYHALSLAALVILLHDPGAVYDLSFQLSFLAVLGIVYAVPKWQERFLKGGPSFHLEPEGRWRRWLKALVLLGLTSLAALMATLPLSVLRFHLVPVMALPANLIMVPLVNAVVLPVALLGSAVFLLWHSVGIWALWFSAWLCDWFAQLVHWGAHFAGGGIYLPSPRPWELVLFYGACVGMCHLHRARWVPRLTLALGLTLLGLWVVEGIQRHLETGLRLHCLSVGNGLSLFVEGPGGGKMLVDGGGTYDDRADIGALDVAPALWHRRCLSLDRLVLSHPHPDHMNGLRFIMRAFKVGGLWDNGERPRTVGYAAFLDQAQARGLPPLRLHRGMKWTMGDAVVEVLHPPADEQRRVGKNESSKTNNASVVIRISLDAVSFLLPGDIEVENESWLVARGGLRSTVLVAPHHGSTSSNSEPFLDAVEPRCVVFSAGRGPRGAGHDRVVERYEKRGVRAFHTGEDGMVSFYTDGRTLRVQTFLSHRDEQMEIEPGWRTVQLPR
jgi:competence protein ComEC